MRVKTHHLGFVVLLLTAVGHSEGGRRPAAVQAPAACAVTKPNGIIAGGERDANSYGNLQVSVGGLWPDGTVVFKPGGPGFVTRDGALGMKFGWMRGIRGALRIEGHRLDAPGPPLRSEVPSGYGERGFQASAVIFPAPGCWEVTGRVGDASVTFVTMVVKIGDGPGWRRDLR